LDPAFTPEQFQARFMTKGNGAAAAERPAAVA